MDNQEFISKCQELVSAYANNHVDPSDHTTVAPHEVYVVWSCKTLQNNKALLSTPLFDGMYYECTYNGDKQELYFDVYKKWENIKYDL